FPSLVDPRARCERRCCCRPRSEHSDVPGAPTHGRVRRARGWTAVAKVNSLWSAFHTGADQSVLHHPGVQKCPDEFQQPLVFDSFGDLTHQFVVIDSVEKLFEVEINHPAVACGDVLLRLGYRLMCRSSRSKTIAVV